jgi:hypothetical protein
MSTLNPLLSKAISFGIKAPNPHNTQAWKIKILDAESFLLYVDETRLLPASDPPARQIHLGQGTFIEMLSVGMTGEGYETLVDYFPEGEYVSEECGRKPVARITVQKTTRSGKIISAMLFPVDRPTGTRIPAPLSALQNGIPSCFS